MLAVAQMDDVIITLVVIVLFLAVHSSTSRTSLLHIYRHRFDEVTNRMLISECLGNDKGIRELRNAIRHFVKTVTIYTSLKGG